MYSMQVVIVTVLAAAATLGDFWIAAFLTADSLVAEKHFVLQEFLKNVITALTQIPAAQA